MEFSNSIKIILMHFHYYIFSSSDYHIIKVFALFCIMIFQCFLLQAFKWLRCLNIYLIAKKKLYFVFKMFIFYF